MSIYENADSYLKSLSLQCKLWPVDHLFAMVDPLIPLQGEEDDLI